jgi:hypothetical protein
LGGGGVKVFMSIKFLYLCKCILKIVSKYFFMKILQYIFGIIVDHNYSFLFDPLLFYINIYFTKETLTSDLHQLSKIVHLAPN